MRRSSYNYETQDPPPFNKNNVGDLRFHYEPRSGPQLQEILASPHLQRELDMYYGQSRSDFHAALMRMRIQQHNESLTSLTDSEFFSDDRDDQTASLTKEKVADNLTRLGRFLDFLSRLPLPLSFTGMGICFLFAVFICPRTCCENLLFPAFRLAFGTLYPAYASYKAVRTKNVKEYVKWMMYWIVYAFFTCIETFTDIFLSWFPFYYEFKVIIVLWLLSPATKGSSTLYRKFVHPMLTRREQEIDEYLNQAKERGYTAVLQLGSKGVNYATNVIMQTALKGGGNLVQTLRRSYSLSDLSEPDVHRTQDEMVPLASSAYGFLPHAIDETQVDEVVRPQRLRPRSQTVRSSSGGRQTMYFSEVDVEPKIPPTNYNYIRSSEDISSGYSSAEPISGGLSRTSSMTNTTRPRFKAKRAEDESSAETDEYDSPGKVRTPIHPSPYMTPYKFNPIKESSRATDEQRDNIEDWKDEVFFSNEQYFQEHEAAKQASSGGDFTEFNTKHMSLEMREKYEMFCKWMEDNEANKKSKEEPITEKQEEGFSKLSENMQNFVEEPQKCLPKKSTEEDFKDTISTASDDEEFVDVIPENKEIVPQTFDENIENDEELSTYVDADKNYDNLEITQSTDKNEENAQSPSERLDAFAKVVILDSEILNSQLTTGQMEAQIKPDLIPDSISEVNNPTENKDVHLIDEYSQSKIVEVSQSERKRSLPIENLIENLAKETEATLSVLKTNLENSGTVTSINLSTNVSKPTTMEPHLTDSALDLSKRPVNHTKGKAPEPPELLTKSSKLENLPLVPPPKPTRSEIPSSSFRESTVSLKTPEPVISPASHSRSPSPKPEGKSKTKKSLFKNYLPSLFRSEPAKQTPGLLDEYHKETQI